MAALFLKPLDDAMTKKGLFYIRFMDDWVVIASSRWKLRRTVATVNRVLTDLLLEKHPDKSFIGKAERGFDFLRYRITPSGLTAAMKTVERFVERAARLYEQDPRELCGFSRFRDYVQRWFRWVNSGLRFNFRVLIKGLTHFASYATGNTCYCLLTQFNR
ncbi:hypothetical protein VT98_12642 [Candidatus Electrothrix communis]|uniref:Reverse transcriptase domain-containing protein n=1 Tax=Candidatus Electrothrix communis TaxID=1859133 RepID=A0A444J0G9_9BACT|nr:hypothetical protein VT98_12642 [Candidatus Electrothrix communis]